MKVNLYVKEPKDYLNYHLFEPILIKNENIQMNTVNFHIPTIIEEVKKSPKSEIKKLKKLAMSLMVTTTSFMGLSSKSMASTIQVSPPNPISSVPVTNLPSQATGIPPELLTIMLTLLTIIVGGAILYCIGMFALAGVLRTMPKKQKEASEWSVNIIKGLVQVMISAPLVFLIYFVANLLFGSSGWFITPFTFK